VPMGCLATPMQFLRPTRYRHESYSDLIIGSPWLEA
jgi:hypothetical protein